LIEKGILFSCIPDSDFSGCLISRFKSPFWHAAETNRLAACAPHLVGTLRCGVRGQRSALSLPKKEMPDVDLVKSSSGILVDVQQRLNCALLVVSLSSGFFRTPKSSRHVPLDDQLIHPKDLAVDLINPRTNSGMNFSLERR
jgi:hypothetical protein